MRSGSPAASSAAAWRSAARAPCTSTASQVRSCITPISTIANRKIVTIEGVGADPVGKALQAAWTDVGVPQCGYCQAGQIMSAAALLKRTPKPTDKQIDDAMGGNICRCGTYTRIRAAIKQAAAKGGA
jgi:isoquinoline 1-oxidoreductase alpha subunit